MWSVGDIGCIGCIGGAGNGTGYGYYTDFVRDPRLIG